MAGGANRRWPTHGASPPCRAHHWLAAEDEAKATDYPTRAGDKVRQEYALDEAIGHYHELLPLLERRGESQAIALVLFKLALALHTSMRFAEANETYQRAFVLLGRTGDPTWRRQQTVAGEQLRAERPGPALGDRMAEHPTLHAALRPSRGRRGRSARSSHRLPSAGRSPTTASATSSICVKGWWWSDGELPTAHDVEFGIKRVLDPEEPGSSAAIYFVLENGQDYCLSAAIRIPGTASAVSTTTLSSSASPAPAPYFLSVMNRPDGGPQPRHAIERDGDAWTATGKQVVSGPFSIVERGEDGLVLERRPEYDNVSFYWATSPASSIGEAASQTPSPG